MAALSSGKSPSLPQPILVTDGSPVHNVGNLRVHASNWGAIGSKPGSGAPFANAPSAEWPAGSGSEYLYEAGLWVGALVDGVPAVSTSSPEYEFQPSSAPIDTVYRSAAMQAGGKRLPAMPDDDHDGIANEDWLNGIDDDGDGLIDEDFAGVSDQMFVRRFSDDQPAALAQYPQHQPMNLLVREESYQWSDADYDDFVGFTFRITNNGTHTLTQAYIGVYANGDVGKRGTPNPMDGDETGFTRVAVDHGVHGTQSYDFGYWFDRDGDNGQVDGYCGIVILDHPTDPSGVTAPPTVKACTFASFTGRASFEDGGLPTNDFERYEIMQTGVIDRGLSGGDVSTLIAVGPFASMAPGETIEFSFALVVAPRDDFTNVTRAAQVYYGRWFASREPRRGQNGEENQEHWYLPQKSYLPPKSLVAAEMNTPPGLSLRVAPNPFRESTTIRFALPDASPVNVSIYDAAGRRVATVLSDERPSGENSTSWNGVNGRGKRVAAGVYFVRMQAGKQTATQKLLLMN